jgi:predicted nucleic acid-binding protein
VTAYADTSFLVSLYTPDANSEAAFALFVKGADRFILTPFGEAESVNAIELRVFRKEISPAQADRSLAHFHRDVDDGAFEIVRFVSASCYERALLLSRQYTRQLGTRGMDVIHVAIALEEGAEVFYTFDRLQSKLASRAGLTVRPGR